MDFVTIMKVIGVVSIIQRFYLIIKPFKIWQSLGGTGSPINTGVCIQIEYLAYILRR